MPQPFRNQFVEPINFGDAVILIGTMDEVWHKPRWISPLLWLSSLVNMLFSETGRDISAKLVITPIGTQDGRSIQRWRRTFRFPRPRRFDATLIYDPTRGALIEALGPGGLLETDWSARFEPPDCLVIESTNAFLRLPLFRLPLPALLVPSVRVVQTAHGDPPDTVSLNFLMRHPLLGEVFGYRGTFRGTRRSRDQ